MAEGAANELKISFVGGEKVGKTSLIKQYTNGTFNPSYEATIGKKLCVWLAVLYSRFIIGTAICFPSGLKLDLGSNKGVSCRYVL